MIKIDKNEKMLLKVRKHWLVLLFNMTFLVGWIIVPLILLVLINFFPVLEIFQFDGNPIFLLGFLISSWLLIVWIVGFITWTDYYLDILIITNRRIFDIEQKGLFNRESSMFRMDRIQDVTVEVNGILATFLNFGDIHIQTAGEGREFIARFIPNPYEVKKIIGHQHDIAIDRLRTVRLAKDSDAPPSI